MDVPPSGVPAGGTAWAFLSPGRDKGVSEFPIGKNGGELEEDARAKALSF